MSVPARSLQCGPSRPGQRQSRLRDATHSHAADRRGHRPTGTATTGAAQATRGTTGKVRRWITGEEEKGGAKAREEGTVWSTGGQTGKSHRNAASISGLSDAPSGPSDASSAARTHAAARLKSPTVLCICSTHARTLRRNRFVISRRFRIKADI